MTLRVRPGPRPPNGRKAGYDGRPRGRGLVAEESNRAPGRSEWPTLAARLSYWAAPLQISARRAGRRRVHAYGDVHAVAADVRAGSHGVLRCVRRV